MALKMDSAADSLLALSNTAVALAELEDEEEDDDRSSSLSELDDVPDAIDDDDDDDEEDDDDDDEPEMPAHADGDSEAETERLEISPDKPQRKKSFGPSPSKLAISMNIDDNRPEIESLTDSEISSPMTSEDELDDDDDDALSDVIPAEEEAIADNTGDSSPNKRKREEDESDVEGRERSRRRRTGSLDSEEVKSELGSEADDVHSRHSREATLEPETERHEHEEDIGEDIDEEEDEHDTALEKVDVNEMAKSKKGTAPMRSSRRRGKEDGLIDAEGELEEEADAGEESEDLDVDDAEAAAKSEEEQAKRMAAMEALTSLEKHFALLRDRLYDERIASINHELTQITESIPSHPELLRQLECVRKYRDDKFEVEQKLLVYKLGGLKNKSVAERSQIHSAYYQTVRDIREKHLERISEHFYRIQRDRFKAETPVPSYTIPFPTRRSQQILQQTAYNKEVSILSGVAKYVGFPAAPELSSSQIKEVDDDMQKMGISMAQIRAPRNTGRPVLGYVFNSGNISAPAAEEQFLEQTPWANPQHPAHRLGLSRQESTHSPLHDSYQTPAYQQKSINDYAQPTGGSTSTILENPSAQASSAINTPHDRITGPLKSESATVNGVQNYRLNHSVSPLETRRANNVTSFLSNNNNNNNNNSNSSDQRSPYSSQPQDGGDFSLVDARASAPASPPTKAVNNNILSKAEDIPRHKTSSPFHRKKKNNNTNNREQQSGLGVRNF